MPTGSLAAPFWLALLCLLTNGGAFVMLDSGKNNATFKTGSLGTG